MAIPAVENGVAIAAFVSITTVVAALVAVKRSFKFGRQVALGALGAAAIGIAIGLFQGHSATEIFAVATFRSESIPLGRESVIVDIAALLGALLGMVIVCLLDEE